MAQFTYRGNLSVQSWPFRSDIWGQTCIVNRNDGVAFTQEQYQRDSGQPQVMYMHNVMPTLRGYQSIGYRTRSERYPDWQDVVQFSRSVITFPGNHENIHAVFAQEDVYLLRDALVATEQIEPFEWDKRIGVIEANFGFSTPWVAYVNGVAYFGPFGGVNRWYKWDVSNDEFDPVTFTGLDPDAGNGLLSSNGLLIVWDDTTISWSSNIDPEDFTPSLATGAGGGLVQEARGPITGCVSLSWGFIIFTTANAVAAVYTGNIRYPFTFKEIQNCGGVDFSIGKKEATKYQKDDICYALTTRGLQQISQKEAAILDPALNDFISGAVLEDFNGSTLAYKYYSVPFKGLDRAVTLIGSRYLCISYGVNFSEEGDSFNLTQPWEYSHAIVYDLALKRFGKFRHPHIDLFEFAVFDVIFEEGGSNAADINRNNIAFLGWNGVVDLVDFTFSYDAELGGNSILILGKYQVERQALCTVENVSFENVAEEQDVDCFLGAAIDGKNISSWVEGYAASDEGEFRSFSFHIPGKNHCVMMQGKFNLTSLELTFKPQAGRR